MPVANTQKADLRPVFARLRSILEPYADRFVVKEDTGGYYYLETATAEYRRKPLMFGAVRSGKNYVGYHLMVLYGCPELVAKLSPALRKRMQGKSCFNFAAVDEALFAELERVTAETWRLWGKMLERLTAGVEERK
jgi:hypothetical protein